MTAAAGLRSPDLPLAAALIDLYGTEDLGGGQKRSARMTIEDFLTSFGLPSLSVAGRLARFDNTGGHIGQTSGLFEDADGRVSIGTTTPAYPFQVRTGANQQLIVEPGTSRGGADGIGITSLNDAYDTFKTLNLVGSPLLLNAAAGGYVGLGTTTPQGLFHVKAATNDNLLVRGHVALSDGISLYATNDNNTVIKGMEFGASKFYFASGNVGIQTDSPSYPLDVNGAARSKSFLITAPSQAHTIQPTGNAFDTLTSMSVQGSAVSNSVREFLLHVGLTVSTGAGATSYNKDKVAIYGGVVANSGGGHVWALNTVNIYNTGWTGSAHGYECDSNNVSGTHADSLSSDTLYGVSATGASTSRKTGAFLVSENTHMWNYGIVFTNNSIYVASFYDQTDAPVSIKIEGAHTYCIDMENSATSAQIRLRNNTSLVWRNAAGSADLIALTGNSSDQLLIGASYASVYTNASLGVGVAPSYRLHAKSSDTANVLHMIEQASTGDAALSFLLSGGVQFTLGIDNSDSDKFKISKSSALGTTDYLMIDTSGLVGIGTTSIATNAALHLKSTTANLGIAIENTAGVAPLFLSASDGANVNIESGAGAFYIRTGGTGVSGFGARRFAIDATGLVGIGTTVPVLTLHARGVLGPPATSGTSQTGVLRVDTTHANTNILDIGGYIASPNGYWLQVTDRTNLALTYPLILQPNGGNAGVNNASPQALLHVGAGGDTPTVAHTIYASLAGATSIGARDSTNNVEAKLMANTGSVDVGAVTDHAVNFVTNNTTIAQLTSAGIAILGSLILQDGITAPSTIGGFASIYVDTADGDLKVRFGDGTIKTIVVDT